MSKIATASKCSGFGSSFASAGAPQYEIKSRKIQVAFHKGSVLIRNSEEGGVSAEQCFCSIFDDENIVKAVQQRRRA
ncbi:hypothetical protein [Nitrobacter hamburgensis]|uniref:hypothetical protein n=1 Tax=Nitrobacter hamburgensis TaxID=912 RepID=UPI0012EDE9D8|nr:hypothetical protein [Nitrobacter hamburgensis]